MDKNRCREFLRRVWGPSEGWAFIAYAGAGQFKHRSYLYPAQLDLLVDELIELSSWANVWFCPHLFRTSTNRLKKNALPPRALWVDHDRPDYDNLKPKPTICWSTSEGKYQALWLLNDEAPPEEAERANRFLTYTNASDKGGWHLNKVLRLPESTNYKYQPPSEGFILWDDGPTYNLEDLLPPEVDDLQKALQEAIHNHTPPMPTEIPSFLEALKKYGKNIPKTAWDLLNADSSGKEDWSEELWKLERLLLEAGIPKEAVLAIVKESPWNKYARDRRPLEHLWAEVFKASQEKGPFQESPTELPWVGMGELMLYSEHPEWMVEGIWMDKNVGWIAGVGKSYKSVLSLDLALSVASGKPFLGRYRVNLPGPVLMVQEEDPIWRVAHRVQVMSHAKGISQAVVNESDYSLVFQLREERIPLYVSVGGGFLFQDEEKTIALERAIDRYRPKLVVLDPLFMMAAGLDEYKSGDMVSALNLMKRWRNDYGCAIAVIHHYNKAGNGGGRKRLYGSMALYAWSENSMFVSRAEGNTIIIERDIKDALIGAQVAVDFQDIDETYSFLAREIEEGAFTGSASQKIAAFLLSCDVGATVTRQVIADATGLTTKTVSKILKEMNEDGLVLLDTKGPSGQLRVTATSKLWDAKKGVELII
jgi:hypothetical protein